MLLGGKIIDIIPYSIASELDIAAGDTLISVNGCPLNDLIDYNYYCAASELTLEVEKADGEIWLCDVEKDEDEDLGIVFSANVFDGIRSCVNNCRFCFVSQLPTGCRDSLYIKDDDYRMSFLQGNYITGTNLSEIDLCRISELRLSPLYISIQATAPEVRRFLLRNKNAGEIIDLLNRLKSDGIEFHGQIVLCPEINDGEVLERSYRELQMLRPNLLSLALVPVGLSNCNPNPEMRLFTKEEAVKIVETAGEWQREAGEDNFLYLADEFYLLADKPFPDYEHYGDFCQLENGIGMSVLFLHQWEQAKEDLPNEISPPVTKNIVTGVSGARILKDIVDELNKTQGLQVNLLPIENKFFGSTVTVSGLVTGSCIRDALASWRAGREEKPELIITSSMLKHDTDLFLDDMTVGELEQALDVTVTVTESDAFSLFDAIVGEIVI